jgi:hypothetical protein
MEDANMTDGQESPWVRIDFDEQAVNNGEDIMFIIDFKKKVPVGGSVDVKVFRLLPLGKKSTFFFSPEAALLGASVLAGFGKTLCDRPNPKKLNT